jgi:hypothetical protein
MARGAWRHRGLMLTVVFAAMPFAIAANAALAVTEY